MADRPGLTPIAVGRKAAPLAAGWMERLPGHPARRPFTTLLIGGLLSLLLHLVLIALLHPGLTLPRSQPAEIELTLPPLARALPRPPPPRWVAARPRRQAPPPGPARTAAARVPRALPAVVHEVEEASPPPELAPVLPDLATATAAPAGAGPLAAAGQGDASRARGAADGSPPPPLPAEGVVEYQVSVGSGDWRLARGTLHWRVSGQHYRVELDARTVGLARLLKSAPVTQISEGRITAEGLRPDQYRAIGRSSDGTEEGAHFDWERGRLELQPGGRQFDLAPGTQDILSVFFQFAIRPPREDGFDILVTNGRKLDHYPFELTERSHLVLPLGEFDTLHISRQHAVDEGDFEIWLAEDQHDLPVQIRFNARGRPFTLRAVSIHTTAGPLP